MQFLPVFLLLSLIAEILGTVGGFGSSVFFVPVANYFFDFESVLGITALFHLSSNISKIALFRKGFDKRLVLTIGLPAMLLVAAGALLSNYISTQYLEIVLGIFLVVLSLFFLIFKHITLKPTTGNAVLGGGLAGFAAGLLGTGGAIRGLSLSAFGLSKDVFIATSAIIDLGIDATRSVVYFYNGYMHTHDLYLIPFLIVVSLLGTYLGKRLLQHISQEQFRLIVLLLILGIGISTIVMVALREA